MKKHRHATLDRYARSITRLAKHLIHFNCLLKQETDQQQIREWNKNVNFIMQTMRKYADAIRVLCDKLDIPDAQKIIADATNAAKQK